MSDVTEKKLVAVHDGFFHADEVFAIAALKVLFYVVVMRTRDEELLKSADMRVDVGGRYNPNTNDYDHHIAGFSERHESPYVNKYEYGPKRSGFGLIFKEFGKEIITKICKKYFPKVTLTDSELREIYDLVDGGLVATIDCIDNGESKYFRVCESKYGKDNISTIITKFNPYEMNEREVSSSEWMECFDQAVNHASWYLDRVIRDSIKTILDQETFLNLLQEQQYPEILVLTKNISWGYAYGRFGDIVSNLQMVVYPNVNGNWNAQSPKFYFSKDTGTKYSMLDDGTRREFLNLAPKEICGLRNEELENKCQIKDVLFVHQNGYLGCAKTKDAAVKLARYIINNSRR